VKRLIFISFAIIFLLASTVTDSLFLSETRRKKLKIENIDARTFMREGKYFDKYSEKYSDRAPSRDIFIVM